MSDETREILSVMVTCTVILSATMHALYCIQAGINEDEQLESLKTLKTHLKMLDETYVGERW